MIIVIISEIISVWHSCQHEKQLPIHMKLLGISTIMFVLYSSSVFWILQKLSMPIPSGYCTRLSSQTLSPFTKYNFPIKMWLHGRLAIFHVWFIQCTVYRMQSVSLIVTLYGYCVKSKWKFHHQFYSINRLRNQ